MKRHTAQAIQGGGGDTEILPANCVFYAPLTKGDLTDHVSGITGQLCTDTKSNASYYTQWNDTEQMYEFYSYGTYAATNAPYALKWSGLNMFSARPNGYTVMMQMKVLQESGNKYYSYFCCGADNDYYAANKSSAFTYIYAHELRNTRPTTLQWLTLTWNGGSVGKWYLGTTLKTTVNTWGANFTTIPDSVDICTKQANNTYCKMVGKNLFVFDKCFEVADIQNIINTYQ